MIVRDVAKVAVAPRTRCYTTSDHCLHPLDSVIFSDVRPAIREMVRHVSDRDDEVVSRSVSGSPMRAGRTPASAGNCVPCIHDIMSINGTEFMVVDVPNAREFVLKLDSSLCDEAGIGGQISAPVNMYKLCAEVVIPQTLVSQQLCRIASSEEILNPNPPPPLHLDVLHTAHRLQAAFVACTTCTLIGS